MTEHKHKQFQRLKQITRGKILLQELLSGHTSFKIGGPADYYVYPRDLEDLTRIMEFCSRESIKYMIIGNGTNILFSDDGYPGVIIDLSKTFDHISCRNDKITVGAGVSLSKLLQFCIERGYSGLEWLAGIPGAVGGSLKMNAGAHGREFSDMLESCRVLDPAGSLEKRSSNEFNFDYRSANISSQSAIVECIFSLDEGNPTEMDRIRTAYLKDRKAKQPLSLPSAGSVFKNPPGLSAGRLLEEAGCKGLRIGDALVSKKHANFIVNCSCASAEDVRRIIAEISSRVEDRFSVKLELEIRMEGFTA